MESLDRSVILPEPNLPDATELLSEGRALARTFSVGHCPFLSTYDVTSESDYKRRRMAERALMFHAQFGYRNFDKSRSAYSEIYERVATAGYRIDRYGICLDWSMGYPASRRAEMPRGTGLILDAEEDFHTLTQGSPVAPHFGDFVMGTPASVENTSAALTAGSTSIGNLGQYFTFRMPKWDDDVGTTAETVKAMALCAAQPVEILIHSNLDDGFAALFTDMACGIGAVLIERYIVEELIGGHVSHCYGHVFSDPGTRLAFQRALAQTTETPGSMVYGNTTIFVENEVENYANLASYLLVDCVAQNTLPTGHGLNPVPVTEALRIPAIDEIVNAHLFANRLATRSAGFETMFDLDAINRITDRLVDGGRRFKTRVLDGLAESGIDTANPFELLLSIRRLGAKRLEELWGPGQERDGVLRKREPVVRATTVAALEAQGTTLAETLGDNERNAIRTAGLIGCVTCTDVHEYGKLLAETVLVQVGVKVEDAGVSTDPDVVANHARLNSVHFIAVSTYSGVALTYLRSLRSELDRLGVDVPVFIGGKLNEVPVDSLSSMPVDVTDELRTAGAVVCNRMEDMLTELVKMTEGAMP